MKSNANRPLPRTIDDITPEWFTSALTIGGVLAGEAVTEVEIERIGFMEGFMGAGSYTHLRAHETGLDLVCRLLLEKKKKRKKKKKNTH